jgi:ribokinase
MSRPSVCVVGSFMLDMAVRAPRRPRPGETVIGTAFDTFLGGKGFNQAVAASRAGARTAMVGRLGDDDFGRRFLEALRVDAIDSEHVVVDAEAGTGIGVPLIEDSGENSIVIIPRANHLLVPRDIERARAVIESSSVLLLQLELPVDTAVAAARIAKHAGTLVVLNPAPAPDGGGIGELHGLVDVIVPNEVEAAALCGAPADRPPIETAVELSGRLGLAVVMTLGGHGCVVADDDVLHVVPAHEVEIVDTVGAGDAFCGALGAWLQAGTPLLEAVTFANAAGALAVTRAGAEPAMPARHDIVELAEPSDEVCLASGDPSNLTTP